MNHFKSNYMQSRFYLMIAIIFIIISVIQPILIIFLMRESSKNKVIIIDDGGNFHLVRSMPFKDAKKLHLECVKYAVQCLFERSSKGVDDERGLKQIFLTNCEDQVFDLIKKEQYEFDKKHIIQDCEIGNIKVMAQKKGVYIANITGQLVRTCKYMNHSYVDVKLFSLGLLMVKNPDISLNGKFPLCVYKITHYKTKDKPDK